MEIIKISYRYSSIAQSVERMTVNHDVTGSSPVGGAKNPECVSVWDFTFSLFTRLAFGIFGK